MDLIPVEKSINPWYKFQIVWSPQLSLLYCPFYLKVLMVFPFAPMLFAYWLARKTVQVQYLGSNTFFLCKFAFLVKSRHGAKQQKNLLLAHILFTHYPLHFSLKAPTVYVWPTFLHMYRSVYACIWKIELYLCLQYIHCMAKCYKAYEYCFCKEKHPHPYFVGSTEYTDT